MTMPAGLNAACMSNRLFAYDTFTDADNTALSAHIPEVGVWSQPSATAKILNNTLTYLAGTGEVRCITPSPISKRITMRGRVVSSSTTYCGVFARYVDANNWYSLIVYNNVLTLGESIAGVYNNRATVAVSFTTGEYTFDVIDTGSSITATWNGYSISYTTSLLPNSTYAGIRKEITTGTYANDFKVEAL